MCRRDLLKTRPTKPGCIELRSDDEDAMSYAQIQFYNDCIRAYADKLGKTVDIAFRDIEKKRLLSVIENSFRSNHKVFVAVRRMQVAVK